MSAVSSDVRSFVSTQLFFKIFWTLISTPRRSFHKNSLSDNVYFNNRIITLTLTPVELLRQSDNGRPRCALRLHTTSRHRHLRGLKTGHQPYDTNRSRLQCRLGLPGPGGPPEVGTGGELVCRR